MASNYVSEGNVVELTMPEDRTSGQGVLVGSIFGVVLVNALSGVATNVARIGTFSINKLVTDVVAQGVKLYWDNTNKRITVTSTANTFAGHAGAAAGNGVLNAEVILVAGGS